MNKQLSDRLFNWKFESAVEHLDDEPDEVIDLVWALSAQYGNCGRFWGTAAVVIAAALKSIGIG